MKTFKHAREEREDMCKNIDPPNLCYSKVKALLTDVASSASNLGQPCTSF